MHHIKNMNAINSSISTLLGQLKLYFIRPLLCRLSSDFTENDAYETQKKRGNTFKDPVPHLKSFKKNSENHMKPHCVWSNILQPSSETLVK